MDGFEPESGHHDHHDYSHTKEQHGQQPAAFLGRRGRDLDGAPLSHVRPRPDWRVTIKF